MNRDQWIESAEALLHLDEKKALVPHGIGGHSRTLLEEAITLLRAHNSDSAEPVLVQHRILYIDTREWSEWRNGDKPLYDNHFETRKLYLASPPAKEVDSDSVTYVLEWTSAPRPPAHPVSMRGRQGFNSIERARKRFQSLAPDSSDVKLTKCVETSTDITAALTNRTPDDEVGNG